MRMLGSAVLMNSSPVFHVSLLKPYHADAYSKPLPPEPEVEDGIPMYRGSSPVPFFFDTVLFLEFEK